MADVSHSAGGRAADRGQLVLVTALSLAVLFVALALIVNTAIYTENLAMRSSDIAGGTDAVRYQDATVRSLTGTMAYANHHNNTSFDALDTELRRGVGDYENATGRLMARSNRAVEVRFNASTNGTRVAQTDPDRNFTDASGDPDWTVAEDVGNVRALELNVTNETLPTPGSGIEPRLLLTNSSGDGWRLNVTSDGSTTYVGIVNGSGADFSCPAPTETPVIDVTAGTIDGEPCDGLILADGLDGAYDIEIKFGNYIEGTYSMVVDNESLAGSPGPHLNDPSVGSPFATYAIYSAQVDVTYQTPRLRYETTVRVAPGEPT